MLASAPTGTALRINGAVRVTGAGVNTGTPAFIHLVSPSNISGHSTFISNPMTNGGNGGIASDDARFTAATSTPELR